MAFARTQLSPITEPKIRQVFAAPFHSILLEGCLAAPLLDSLSHSHNPIYIGRNIFKDSPPDVLLNMAKPQSYCYCLDFSRFDTSVNHSFFDWFFMYLDTYCHHDSTSRNLIKWCHYNLTHTTVLFPDGSLYSLDSGLASGSYFTQIIGSYVNLILMYALQLHFFKRTFPTFVLGDDSLFFTEDVPPLSIDSIAEFFQTYGFRINSTKSVITSNYQDIIFLGHNYRNSRLSRPDWTLLQLAYYVERPVSTPEESLIRILSLLTDSAFSSNLMSQIASILRDTYSLVTPHSFGPPPHYSGLFSLT